MSSIVRTGGSNIDRSADLRGLSTDIKPTKAQGDYIPHGSTWYNMDDCTKYMYNEDNDTWYNIPNGGGGTGDMQKSVYDPTNTVANAGGIDTYVGDEISIAKSEIITEVEGNIATTANNLINDTVGWTNKNLLPITLDQLQAINTSGTWEDNVYTYRGITITVDIFNNLITGISVNGANTAGSVVFKLTDNFVYQLLSEDKYYISDGVDTTAIVSGSAYISVERKKGESGESHYLSTNNEERSTKFTVDYSIYDYYFVNIYIPNNSSINNAVFYPMIRRASISDDTYEPYTKTVKDEIFNLNSSVGNLKSRVGIAEGNIQTLNSIKANKSDLGTASTKNSTSVVTESSDLVESGAVKDIVGWGNKNKLQVRKELTSTSLFTVNRNNYDEVTSIVGNGSVTAEQTLWLIGNGWDYSNCEDASKYFKAGHTYTLSDGTNNDNNQFIQLNIRDSEGVIISARSDNLNTYYRTFTMPSDLTGLKVHCWLRVNNGQSMTNKAFYPQVEEGASITSFEPYHASVEETLRDAEVIEGKNLYADEQDIQFGSAYNLRTKTIPLTKPLGAGTYTLNLQNTGTADINMQIRYNGSYHGFPSLPYTFTVNSGSTCDSIYIYISQTDYDGGKSATASEIQIEVGTGATAYEPYYIPLKDVVPNKCDNSVIGTVEDGTNPTKSYAVGEHFIRNGKFCTVTVAVTTSSTWTLGSNYVEGDVANSLVYKAGDSISVNTNTAPMTGYITSGSTEVYCVLELPREVLASSLTVSNVGAVTIRGIDGYVANNDNTIVVTLSSIRRNRIALLLKKSDSTAFTGTNNTPVTVDVAFTITFA